MRKKISIHIQNTTFSNKLVVHRGPKIKDRKLSFIQRTGSHINMHPFNDMFVPLGQYRVAICSLCHYAVLPGSIKTHVDTHHRYLPAQHRQQIAAHALELKRQGVLASSSDGIRFPTPEDTAVPGLPVWADGKKCMVPGPDGQACGHIRRTKRGIQVHCGDSHSWVNRRARGGKPGAVAAGGQDDVWVDGIHCQQFGKTGALQRLFEVTPAPSTSTVEGSVDQSQPNPAEQIMAQFGELAKAVKDKDQNAAAVIGEQSRFSANMWVRRTGWPRHLRGFDREWLAGMAQPQDMGKGKERNYGDDEEDDEGAASEEALARVLLAVDRVIWRAQRVSRVDIVGSAAINYISRREAGGESNEKPFHAEQKGQTMERYAESWKSVVAYVWRTFHLQPADAAEAAKTTGSMENRETDGGLEDEGDGNRKRGCKAQAGHGEWRRQNQRPAYHFTAHQAEVWVYYNGEPGEVPGGVHGRVPGGKPGRKPGPV
ncbi:hypothetical protein B0H66DRAFT_643789 [Apodospora peruviana]|uniref:Uncharacterized protein n=1 Tax=Apodospora peruviana TaxID=516989 RepID=A0AAE0HX11_9PEZI|nr:hypothetical protein B0H66DRAFT_643789 [Apodospora peruviana]